MEDLQKIVCTVTYRMAPIPMTLSDVEGHLSCMKCSKSQACGSYSESQSTASVSSQS